MHFISLHAKLMMSEHMLFFDRVAFLYHLD
jgi:hypothetical protein